MISASVCVKWVDCVKTGGWEIKSNKKRTILHEKIDFILGRNLKFLIPLDNLK